MVTAECRLGHQRQRVNKVEIREYLTTNERALTKFRTNLEEKWSREGANNVTEMLDDMEKVAERTLKRRRREETLEDGEKREKPWISENTKRDIKKRNELNRAKRNEKDKAAAERLTKRWKEQKYKVQQMVKKELEEHEINVTNEIKSGTDRQKKLWKNLNKLRGKENKNEDDFKVFDEAGKEIDKITSGKLAGEHWGQIYRAHNNDITEIWGEEVMEEMLAKNKKEEEEIKGLIQTREHLDMAMKVDPIVPAMEESKMDKEKITDKIRNGLKTKKSGGTTMLKSEVYKEIEKSEVCMDTVSRCYRDVIDNRNIPERWKESRTKLIPKKKKTTIKDFRPIALTNISYKIFMSILKDEIEDHLEKSLLTKDNQTGFTKGGKKEDNLFMLQYLVGKAYKNKKPLILIAIDYSKAYDSLDRKKLIEALMEYKIHPHIIDIIAKLYQGDHTKIKIGDSEEKIDISSGIKQGCTLSTTLFKIVTYLIIKELENKGRGYKVDDIILQSLYFADDSILAAESIEDARHNLNILIEVSKKFGLNINRDKCNVLIYNNHEEIKEIDNIKVVENIKYLGITIDNKKDIFKTQKKYLIDSAQ